MRTLVENVSQPSLPESCLEQLLGEPGVVFLRSGQTAQAGGRYSFLTARPFLTFESFGSRCEIRGGARTEVRFGDPWRFLQGLLCRYELRDEIDLPFPLGGCFGYWGYDLKNFLEPHLPRRAICDLELPECHLGFYDSLVVFDHLLGTAWILSTGLEPDGSRDAQHAREQSEFWQQGLRGQRPLARLVESALPMAAPGPGTLEILRQDPSLTPLETTGGTAALFSNLSRPQFLSKVEQAQRYIRSGDIYQVNLSHRLTAPLALAPAALFQVLGDISPAPFSAYLDTGRLQLLSASPELFLQLTGAHIQTRPIKGTRARSADPAEDAQLSYQLQTSPKELAELVMITDLLRNDLGKVCEFGSVRVPELARLERFAQVQHLVSTVEGNLRPGLGHLDALAACFPGGSVTGAPKIRAMQIIDELEPISRGPYTGALGYLGFNRESQVSMIIRTALCKDGLVHFQTGSGIVADSVPEAEYAETLAKARGFIEAMQFCSQYHGSLSQRPIRS